MKNKKMGRKLLQIVYILLKPFIPYILMFITIFFFIVLIIDAIFVEFTNNKGQLNISEEQLQRYCETASSYEIYLDNEITNESLDSKDSKGAITWEQIYALLLFYNISEDKNITSELAQEIAKDFKSKYYYKTSKIITEQKIVDNEGSITWEKINEETTKLLTESITVAGHYTYEYEEKTIEERRH